MNPIGEVTDKELNDLVIAVQRFLAAAESARYTRRFAMLIAALVVAYGVEHGGFDWEEVQRMITRFRGEVKEADGNPVRH